MAESVCDKLYEKFVNKPTPTELLNLIVGLDQDCPFYFHGKCHNSQSYKFMNEPTGMCSVDRTFQFAITRCGLVYKLVETESAHG